MTAFITSSSSADRTKPKIGENSRASPIFVTWSQSTPDVPSCPRMSALATPTPTIEPIRVCELEAGMPSKPRSEIPDDCGDQQSEHHRIAGARADLQNELDRQERDDAEGDGAARGKHAEQVPASRPDDRDLRREGMGIDDGRDGVGGVMETIDEFEAERDQHARRRAAGMAGSWSVRRQSPRCPSVSNRP